MHVAVTGGTGYVGAHSTRALLAAGHAVRLLISPNPADEAVARRLALLGDVEILSGDVRDEACVEALLADCDALLHGAGVVGTDNRREQLMWEVNAYATEAVLQRAVERGLDPVISISSYSALFPSPDGVIGPDTPTAAGRSAYARTKAYADRAARRLQRSGAPVVVTYPSSIVGPPLDTAAGVTERGWAPITRWAVAPRLRGGMQMIDVADVAEVHARAVVAGRGPRRYVCGGTMVAFDDMITTLETGLGRRIRRVPVSQRGFLALGRIADALGGVVRLGDGFSYEAAMLLTAATPTDDSFTLRELGMTWRPPQQAILASLQR